MKRTLSENVQVFVLILLSGLIKMMKVVKFFYVKRIYK